MPDEDGFLDRWSRRKQAHRQGEVEPEETTPPDETAGKHPAGQTADGEPPAYHPAEDIDIDSLEPGADFSVFMQKGVPAALKRRALRKLWSTNPLFYEREHLTDMFDIADTKTWGIGPTRATSWQFGRGFLKADEVVRPTRPEVEPEGAPEGTPEEAIAEAPPDAAETDEAAAAFADEEAADESGDADDPAADERDKG